MANKSSEHLQESGNDTLSEKHILSREYAQKIFIQSFRHSQGDLKLQKHIFAYLHSLHPDWRITYLDREFLRTSVIKALLKLFDLDEKKIKKSAFQNVSLLIKNMISNIFKGEFTQQSNTIKTSKYPHGDVRGNSTGGFVPEAVVEAQVEEELTVMVSEFEEKLVKKDTLKQLGRYIIDRDFNYFFIKPRPNRPEFSEKDTLSIHDPHLSFFCFYGIEKHSTGISEYDQMYSQLCQAFLTELEAPSQIFDKETLRKLKKLVESYYQSHKQVPEAQSFLNRLSTLSF